MSNQKILIIGAAGAIGTLTLLKLYGKNQISVLLLPRSVESFLNEKHLQSDKFFPTDTTVIPKDAYLLNQTPQSPRSIGVFTEDTLDQFDHSNLAFVVVASKAFHYNSIIPSLKKVLSPNIPVLLLANGLSPEDDFLQHCEKANIHSPCVRAVIMGGTHYSIDNQKTLVHNGISKYTIGKWNNFDDNKTHYNTICQSFDQKRFTIETPPSAETYRQLCFDKILANLVNPISFFGCFCTIEYVEHPPLNDLITKCIREGLLIASLLNISLDDEGITVKSKMEMYKNAGESSSAHLPSMGQDSIMAILNKTALSQENVFIGEALTNVAPSDSEDCKNLNLINRIVSKTTEYYNTLFQKSSNIASQFLLTMMMRCRKAVGLDPANRALYSQYPGLKNVELSIPREIIDHQLDTHDESIPQIFSSNLSYVMKQFDIRNERI